MKGKKNKKKKLTLPERGHLLKNTAVVQGRKPSRLKNFLKDFDIGKKDLDLLMKNLVYTKTLQELESICNDNKQLIIVRLFAKVILQDYHTGYLNNMEKIFNRLYGVPKQTIDANIEGPVNLIISPDDKKVI